MSSDELLGSVRRLSGSTAAGASADALAASIADEIVRLLDADVSAVMRFDGEQVVVVGGSARPGYRIFTAGARFPIEPEMLAGRIRDTGRPVRHAAYGADPSDAARRVRSLGIDVVIGAPVHVDGRVWGTIYAAAADVARLPAGTEGDLSVFADLVAIAVASAEDRSRLASQAAEQQALTRVARALLERAPEPEILTMIARDAAALLGAPAAALFKEPEGADSAALTVWPPDTNASTGVDPEVLDRIRAEQTTVSLPDPDPTAPDRGVRALGRPVWWGAPIMLGGRLWGVLVVAADEGTPVPHDASERVTRFAQLCGVAMSDLEARRSLEEQLVETQRLAALVELSDDFIAVLARDDTIAYLNEGGRRLVGLASPEDALGRPALDFLAEHARRHYVEVAQPELRRARTFRGETTLRHLVTNEDIPVSTNSFIVTHPVDERIIGTAVVIHDLRASKRAERELRERAEEVEQLAAARRSLLVEVLRGEERMRRQIADVLHDDVLQELHAARLDLERIHEDTGAPPRVRVAVDAATRRLREAVSDLHPAATSTHGLEARLRSVLDQGGERAGFGHRLTVAVTDPGGLEELLIALVREFVHNVVKHAGATFVVAEIRQDGDGLHLEVADDGRGMEPERPAEALRAGHIGLASSQERVEAVGGRMTIESEPGNGTRVRVELPPRGRESS